MWCVWYGWGLTLQRAGGGICARRHAYSVLLLAHARDATAYCVTSAQQILCCHAGRVALHQTAAGVFSIHPFLLGPRWRTSPLKARWGHGRTLNDRKGQSPTTTSTGADRLFCSYDASVDQALTHLHAILQSGERDAQADIDQYIVSSTNQAFAHLRMHRSMPPHYDNLPDISRLVEAGISHWDNSGASDMEKQASLLIRQCTPLRRRSRRAQREVLWKRESLNTMRVIIRCAQGTLLNLYPRSSRHVAYSWRTALYAFLRTLLVQPFEKLNACLNRIRYICKLCLMEHVCNTITDYHPGLAYVLNNGIEQISLFTHGVTTMCDTFRGEINTAFSNHGGATLPSLEALEPVAHSLFERCTRSFRGMIMTNESIKTCVSHKRRHVNSSMEVFEWACSAYMSDSRYVFDALHVGGIIPEDRLDEVWRLVYNVQVFDLPTCVQRAQMAVLNRTHHMDKQYIDSKQWVHVCLFCALRGGDSRPGRLYFDSAKFRHDCETGSILCSTCNLMSVIRINMLGRVLRLSGVPFVLSCCCASLVQYDGSGVAFQNECGPHCSSNAPSRAKNKVNHFFICKHKYQYHFDPHLICRRDRTGRLHASDATSVE